MSETGNYEPDFGELDVDELKAVAEIEAKGIMIAQNRAEVLHLITHPALLSVPLALEPFPEIYGGPTKVPDDKKHQKLLRQQLTPLGAVSFEGEEPYLLTGKRRIYKAVLMTASESDDHSFNYWLDEQHRPDSGQGPQLRLVALRNDPREPSIPAARLKEIIESQREREAARNKLRRSSSVDSNLARRRLL